MTVSIQTVDTAYISQIWPKVETFIKDALEKGGDFPDWAASYNINHVQQYLTSGAWLLFVGIDEANNILGAATVSFINCPLHRIAFVTTIGGHLITSQDTFEQFSTILKARGATKIQGYCRPAILRLWKRYKFEPRNTLAEVLL